MITANVIHRTFHVRCDGMAGTAFVIDLDERQYLVTARHVVKSVKDKDICTVKLFYEKEWLDLDVRVVGSADGDVDISVLAVRSVRLSPPLELLASSEGLVYGQDLDFLGFPYDLKGDMYNVNRNFPIPFVKKAIMSNMLGGGLYYLDGHNNPGFSGGPVVFKKATHPNFCVAGVVSGYASSDEPIYHEGKELPLTYRYNTGLIKAYDIAHAVSLIKANPVGLRVA